MCRHDGIAIASRQIENCKDFLTDLKVEAGVGIEPAYTALQAAPESNGISDLQNFGEKFLSFMG